ncbi:MAG: hypothetical protein U5K53_06640 [Halanaerobiales bacterium]|nr:hypothetical protein [Halanaerobiales bacterium]
MEQEYYLNKEGSFIIKNYQSKPTFSSFLPGIAGKLGIPIWAFYVNRGQGIASFGIKNKDNPIMEFYPANKSYSNVVTKGFRTFIKINNKVYEPFRKNNKQISSEMIISLDKLEITEINKEINIKTNVIYHTLPNENFGGLIRRLEVTNLDNKKRQIEVLDGMPIIIPFGIDNNALKNVSQTITAWIKVYNLDNNIPFFRLKASASDEAKVDEIKSGNYFISIDNNSNELLPSIVDPRIVFSHDKSLNKPIGFINNDFSNITDQITENQFPSAMTFNKKTLNQNDKINIFSLFGNVNNQSLLKEIKNKVLKNDYFESKLKTNQDIHNYYTDLSFTNSENKNLNGYIKQTFLDNMLRGGLPVNIGKDEKKTYHIFSRKHGDLERDYNDFLLEPRYYSQGNGNYRDINQNRRSDLFFNPHLKKHNIKTFFNLINLEGFNPLVIHGQKFVVKNIDNLKNKINLDNDKLFDIITNPYSIGELYEYLISNQDLLNINNNDIESIVNIIIDNSKSTLISSFGEGYWIDHWTYNLDLIENYLRIYPDKLEELFTKEQFRYYDSHMKVLPRHKKYQLTNRGPRQYKALKEDKKKKDLINNREQEKNYVRVNDSIYKSNLIEKIFVILLNKVASIDPYGLGIEMEANKPGWYDALNGLPGIFGSSFGETAEVIKWAKFMKSTLEKLEIKDIEVLKEVYEFYKEIDTLLIQWFENKDNYLYWDQSNKVKEEYREKIFYSLDGRKNTISKNELLEFYENIIKKLNYSLDNSKNEDGLYNMFNSYEVEKYTKTGEISDEGLPLVKVKSFKIKPLANFLEGQVKAHKVLSSKNKSYKLHENILSSDLYDKKLKMFRVNGNLSNESFEIGRAKAFSPGWLENGSIWLHMEYKYLLELLKNDLYETFYEVFNDAAVFHQDPKVYKRSILENSSFILSSLNNDVTNHGRGYIARLSGATAEFIDMWTRISFGNKPFKYINNKLIFEPNPILTKDLFTKEKSEVNIQVSENISKTVILPKNTYSIRFLGSTLVVYHNKKMKNTFGENKVKIESIKLTYNENESYQIQDSKINNKRAYDIRNGLVNQIDIILN